ncbi:MAG: hypothetical protein HQL52_02105 [Magnetococcales bacterium]|nr:hypothetical protein [Magnetococcales bacterium]
MGKKKKKVGGGQAIKLEDRIAPGMLGGDLGSALAGVETDPTNGSSPFSSSPGDMEGSADGDALSQGEGLGGLDGSGEGIGETGEWGGANVSQGMDPLGDGGLAHDGGGEGSIQDGREFVGSGSSSGGTQMLDHEATHTGQQPSGSGEENSSAEEKAALEASAIEEDAAAIDYDKLDQDEEVVITDGSAPQTTVDYHGPGSGEMAPSAGGQEGIVTPGQETTTPSGPDSGSTTDGETEPVREQAPVEVPQDGTIDPSEPLD